MVSMKAREASTEPGDLSRESVRGWLSGRLGRIYRWPADHTRSRGAALGLFLGIGLSVAVLSAAGFALLAHHVGRGNTQAFDTAVVEWMRDRRGPWLDVLAVVGAVIGSGAAIWATLGLGTLFFWKRDRRLSALLLWISLLGGIVLNRELKALFDRPRPEPVDWTLTVLGRDTAFPSSQSFPSGHAVTAVVVLGTLAYLVMRTETTPGAQRATLGAAAGLIAFIGISRVYLGVHYPSDVLAGYLAGFVWTSFVAGAAEVSHLAVRRQIRSPAVVPNRGDSRSKHAEPSLDAEKWTD